MTDELLALRWSRQDKGWIEFRDPETGEWDAVWHRDMPGWRHILLANIGAHRKRRDEPSAEPSEARFRCGCGVEHERCEFGLGLACVEGDDCANPHHDRQPWVVRGFAIRPVNGTHCGRRKCAGDGDAHWEITAPAGFSLRPRLSVCDGCFQAFLAATRRSAPDRRMASL